jgi:2',3'-cyclic-nucleotide 2'-phosphodiesterase/3'-nucleotidase
MKNYLIKKTYLTFITIFTVLVCSTSVLIPQSLKLKIIETSDVHGTVFPYDFINDKDSPTSLAQVHTFVQQERNTSDQQVILLDNGDILQGQPVVYYYNFVRTDTTHLYADVMNYMRYDAATVGNHDIETGHPVYDKFRSELNFPWLAANAIDIQTGEPYFEPYTIIEKEGFRIAVLGLITPGIPNWLPKKIWEGIEFEDMIVTAEKWVKKIIEKEKPDLMIGLFHSGVDYTYNNETAETPRNENASKLIAEKIPGFDLIFVGHDHRSWNFTLINSEGDEVLILGTRNDAKNVAAATVLLERTDKGLKKNISGELIEIQDFNPDEEFMRTFASGMNEVKNFVSKKIGLFEEAVSTKESMFGNSKFIDLIHTIQLELTEADVSFAAPLSFNAVINEGDVFVRDMFKLYRYENLLYTMSLTGKEIKDYLEYSYGLWFNTMTSADDYLLNYKTDDEGNITFSNNSPQLKYQFYNFSSAAGINYTVDVSKPVGQRVTILSMSDGSNFHLDKTYKAAINSYRGNGGGGHLTKGAGIAHNELPDRIVASTERDLRYFLMKWIEKTGIVVPTQFNNWEVIPNDWWQKGREREMKLLYCSK